MLGNRQLVSVFLIVVILLGVFFSMGYIVGRNSAQNTAPVDTARNLGTSKPIVVENPAKAGSSGDQANPAAGGVSVEVMTPEKPSPMQKPAPRTAAPASEAKPEKKVEDTKADHKTEPVKSPPVENERQASVGEPAPGEYLQVVATSRADAEIVAESLIKKGFHAMVAPVPGSNLNRVIVGPVKDAADLAETRTRLEEAGFKPYVRRY